MLGRDRERAHLDGALAAAAAGQATVVSIVGDYGQGKTALLDQVRADAAERGLTVLATQGRAADAEVGFASLLSLMRPIEARLDELAGDLAGDLRAALALGRRKAQPIALRVATLRVLAACQPLVVLVDDAHLLDRASADVLAFAVGRLHADAVLTVVAAERYAPTAFDDLDAETIVLGDLDDEVIAGIVTAAHRLSPEPLRRCVELAAGNPLAALEIAASLDPADPLPSLPRVPGGPFAARLERLSATARHALAMVAADDSGELAVVLDALRRVGEPEGGLREAEEAGLVATEGATVRLAHPLLRPVAYHRIGPASRRVAHGALAAALAAPHQGASRAWQLVAAAEGPDEAVSSALVLVAADVARRGGTASAARTLECAAALAPEVDQRRTHLVSAVRAWLDAGEAPAAARVADGLAALPPTVESVAIAASALRWTRPAAQVLAFVEAAAPAVPIGAVLAESLLAAGATDGAATVATTLPARTDGAGQLARAVLSSLGEPVPDPLDAAGAGSLNTSARVLATAAAADGGLDAGGERPLVALGGPGLDLAVSRAVVALHRGEVSDAHDQLLRLDAVAGPGLQRAGLELALAEVELLLGRSGDAQQRAAGVAAGAAELGLGWLRGRAAWVLGRVALAAGDDRAAADHLRAACRVAPHLATADLVLAVPSTPADPSRRWIGDRAPILDVRARRAIGALDAALDRADAAGLPLEAATVVLAIAERAWRSGDIDGAATAAADARRRWAVCGVTGWAPRLARLDRPTAPKPPSLASRLSPAEHRVALAVAEGRTNQEAAETLFLSVKTVDFHLQNIYRKLHLRSRTELAVVVHHGTLPEEVAL